MRRPPCRCVPAARPSTRRVCTCTIVHPLTRGARARSSAPQTTAAGDVRKALAGFLLLAPCLSPERCAQVEARGAGAPQELIRGGDLEALWPRAQFSPAVNTAKRAFINRLGTDLAVACG